MGALSCFKNVSTVPTRSLKLRGRGHSCGKYSMFCSGSPKMLRCEGWRRWNWLCAYRDSCKPFLQILQ